MEPKVEKIKVLLADDDPIIRLDLRMALEVAGYAVAGEACDGIEAVGFCESEKPDVVLMDIQMPLFNGLKAAEMIYEKQLCDCILILTAYNMDELVSKAAEKGIMGYLIKPVTHEMLIPAIQVALSRAKDIRNLKNEVVSARKTISDQKKLARAKGILMKRQNCTEEEAYLQIQKLAMNKRCSMAAISEMLIKGESDIIK